MQPWLPPRVGVANARAAQAEGYHPACTECSVGRLGTRLTLAELQALYAELSQLLAETAFDTASRRNCLGSLENTIREINARFGSQWKLSVGP